MTCEYEKNVFFTILQLFSAILVVSRDHKLQNTQTGSSGAYPHAYASTCINKCTRWDMIREALQYILKILLINKKEIIPVWLYSGVRLSVLIVTNFRNDCCSCSVECIHGLLIRTRCAYLKCFVIASLAINHFQYSR